MVEATFSPVMRRRAIDDEPFDGTTVLESGATKIESGRDDEEQLLFPAVQ